MKIAICSGKIDSEIISGFLRGYFAEKRLTADIKSYECGEDLIRDFDSGKNYDAVFIDIYLKQMLGIDAAISLRERGFDGGLVLIGETNRYAVDGYRVGAIGYILKPLKCGDIKEAADRLLGSFEDGVYRLKHYRGVVNVPYDEIIYIDSKNSKCILHRAGGQDYNIYKKLDVIEKELDDSRFLRCHQSYIVNMTHVADATDKFIMESGETVYIRNRDIRAIRSKYLDFIGK